MYTSTTIILTLLGAGALALPATTNSTIRARDSEPNVGAYKDPKCIKSSLFDKTHDVQVENCIKFVPGTDYVGINWGIDGWDAMTGLRSYSDDNCQNPTGKTIMRPSTYDYIQGGANTCVAWKMVGGPWRSVQQLF